MPHKTYNTPKRKCVVKTRLTEDERRAFEDKCAALSMSQSEYIRQAVFYSRISPVIRVTAHSEEMLTAISSLVAQYGKIGSNLNQIARYLNEYGAPYNALSSEVRAAVSDLAALKFEVLKVVTQGNLVQNWPVFCASASNHIALSTKPHLKEKAGSPTSNLADDPGSNVITSPAHEFFED